MSSEDGSFMSRGPNTVIHRSAVYIVRKAALHACIETDSYGNVAYSESSAGANQEISRQIASLIRVSSVFQTESWPCGVIWLNSGLEGTTYFGLGSGP